MSMEFIIIVLGALAAAILFLSSAYVYWRWRYGPPGPESIPILAYHKVGTRFELGGTWVTPARFRKQMEYLKARGYTAVTLSDAAEMMRDGRSRQGRYVCITFDDAYGDLYAHAWPVLRELGFAATVYAVTAFAGRDNTWDINWGGRIFPHLSWEQMREMQDGGVEFGSHTVSHYDLRFLGDDALDFELSVSKREMEARLGKPVTSLSYPFGRYDARVRAAAIRAGYTNACSLCPRSRNSLTDPYALRRCGVYVTDVMWDFRNKVDQTSRWFWIQDLFCRAVNFCSGGTALVKRWRGYRPAVGE